MSECLSREQLIAKLHEALERQVQLEEEIRQLNVEMQKNQISVLAWEALMNYDQMPVEVYLKNTNHEFLDANVATLRIHNLERNEIRGLTDHTLMHPYVFDAHDNQNEENNILKTGQPVIERLAEVYDRSQRKKYLKVTKLPVYNNEKKIVGIVGINYDITELVNNQYRTSNDLLLLRTIIDNIPANIFVKNTKDVYIYSSKAHAVFHGKKSSEEIEGITTEQLLSSQLDSLKNEIRLDDQLILLGEKKSTIKEELLESANGTHHWFVTTKVPLHDAMTNEVVGIVGISQNITRVHQESSLLKTLIDNIPDFVYVKDSRSRFVLANKALVAVLGLNEPHEFVGKRDHDFYPAEMADKFYTDEQLIIQKKVQRIDVDELGLNADGHEIWVHTTKIPVMTPDENIQFIVGIGHDVTAQKKQYEIASARAEQLDELNEGTLSIASNQLNMAPLLNLITEQAVNITNTRSSGLYKYDESNKMLILVAETNRPQELGASIEFNRGIAGYLVASGRTEIFVPDYGRSNFKIDAHTDFLGMVYAVLLKSNDDRIVGILYVEGERNTKIEEQRREIFQRFSRYACEVLANAIRIEEERETRRKLEKLAEINSSLIANLRTVSTKERLSLIAFHATEILNSEACTLLLVKKPRYLSHEASYGYDLKKFPLEKEFEIVQGEKLGLTGYIASLGKPFRIAGKEYINHPAVKGNPESTPLGKAHSVLMVPISDVSTDEIVGWLRVDNKKDLSGNSYPNIGFSDDDIAIASLFANVAFTIIQAAKIVNEIDQLLSIAPFGVIAADTEGRVTQTNRFAENIFEFSTQEFDRISVSKLYRDEDEAQKIGALLNCSEYQRLDDYRTYIRTKSGKELPIQLSVLQLFDATNQYTGTVGYFQNLQELNQAQLELDQERLLLSTLIDHIPDYVYVKNLDGNFVKANKEVALRMGVQHPSELLNQNDFKYYSHELASIYKNHEIEVIKTKTPKLNYEEPFIDLITGEKGTLLTSKVPWIDEHTGVVKGIIGIGRNITKLRRMYDAFDELITLNTPDEILQTALRFVFEAGLADWVTVILFDTAINAQVLLNYPYDGRFQASHIRKTGLSVGIMNTGQPFVCKDILTMPYETVNDFTHELGYRGVLGLPMTLHAKRIGVVWLHYKKPQSDFSEELIKNVQFYVNQVTIAYDRLRRMRSLEQMQAAFSVAVEASAIGDHQATLQEIVNGTRAVLGCDAVTLYTFNPDINDLNYKPTMINVQNVEKVTAVERKLQDSFVYRMLQNKDILIIPNTAEYEEFNPENRRFVRDEGIKSCLVIPLAADKIRVGVMFVNYRQLHSFEEQEIINVRLFAAQASVAINNARLYMMRQTLFVNLAHELHLPITGIIADSEIIRDELAKTSFADLRELAEHNLGQVERAALITDTLLSTLGKDIVYKPVYTLHSLYRPLIEACQLFKSEARASGCEIREPIAIGGSFPSIKMSLKDMTIALKNIIGNAVKYSYSSNNHYIKIEGHWYDESKTKYIILIQNYGVGITKEEIESGKIFELYYRGVNATDRHRTGGGIGLTHSLYVIKDLHQGAITVDSIPVNSGAYLTTFRIILPINTPCF